MTRHRFIASIAGLLLAAIFFTAVIPGVRAQSSPSHHAVTHMRLWKAELHSFPYLRVALVLAADSPKQHALSHEIGNAGPGFMFSSYSDVPAGRATLSVFSNPPSAPGSKGPKQTPLVSVPVDFAPNSFLTVMLAEPPTAGAPPQPEVTVDSGNGGGINAGPAQFTARSFVAGLKDVRVTLGDALNAQFAFGDSFLQMRGLKPVIYTVHTVGTGADGKRFDWTNEVDLKSHRAQTLLIYPDPYGRIRPRVIADGENEAEQPADKSGQTGQR